jgi:hypothetical protein
MKASPTFERLGTEVLSSILAGASPPEAAHHHDLSPRTVQRWLKKGREDPAGPYGNFARIVDDAHEARSLPEELPLDEGELRGLLARTARRGNVQAMKLYFDVFLRGDRRGPSGQLPGQTSINDPFDELEAQDQAARRQGEGG